VEQREGVRQNYPIIQWCSWAHAVHPSVFWPEMASLRMMYL
jgi:hypothetical protein